MAKSNFFPVVLLLSLFIAFHVHARESQFFSKFTANSNANPADPSNESSEYLEKQSLDPPSFVAETQNGFGLYSHESGQLPPSETTSAADTTSFSDEPYYNKDVFATEDETAGDTKAMLQGSSYDSVAVNGKNNYFPRKSFGNVVANGRNNYYAVGNRYVANDDNNVHQQQQEEGMSDTRFVENGRYYYNANDEEKYNSAGYPDSLNEEFNNNNQGGYYGDSYEAAAAAAGGYKPAKDMNEFRATENVDEEFMP